MVFPGTLRIGPCQVHEKFDRPLVDMTSDASPQGKALYLNEDPAHINARGNELTAWRFLRQ
jgi:hypothetical protein